MTFVQSVKKEIQVERDSFWQFPLVVAGLWVFGMVLGLIITFASGENEEFVPMGFILALVGAVISIFFVGAQMHMGFKLAVGMGTTRKSYLGSYYAVSFLLCLECYVVAVCTILLDKAIWALGFSHMKFLFSLPDYVPLFWWPIILVAAAAVSALAGAFFAALIYKWGQKAFWILWSVWMIGFVLLPQLASRWKDTAVAKFVFSIGGLLGAIPLWGWGVIALSVLALMPLTTVLIMRKEAVRI